jgi:hypothetical protein
VNSLEGTIICDMTLLLALRNSFISD